MRESFRRREQKREWRRKNVMKLRADKREWARVNHLRSNRQAKLRMRRYRARLKRAAARGRLPRLSP